MGELSQDSAASLRFDLAESGDGTPLVTLAGELDMSNADGLKNALAPVIARSPERLVVELRELEFADSSAIALLVQWANRVPTVELHHPPELLRRVIDRMGLADRLHMSA